MKVQRTLSIEEIYRKVRDYDLVFTTEASLADALNNRVESPRIGKLAYTPRTFLYRRFQNRELKTKKDLFVEAIRNLNFTWKETHYLLERIIKTWEETGDPENISSFPQVESSKALQLLEIVKDSSCIYQRLEEFSLPENENICAVGLYQFNELDRSILPDTTQSLELFTEEKVDLPPFRVFSSDADLVGSVVDNIRRLEEEEIAVVVHPESPYDSLLRSHLRQAKIRFQVAGKLRDSEDLRTFIQILEIGLRYPKVKIKEAAPLLRKLGVDLGVERQEEYLSKVEGTEAGKLQTLFASLEGRQLGEIIGKLNNLGFRLAREIKKVFDELQIRDRNLTESTFNNLKYYLDSFDIDYKTSGEGLILANPSNVTFIDRSVVFYLGISTRWDQVQPDRPWDGRRVESGNNLKDFKSLLQNGESQFFMVRNEKMNRKVIPSTYFNEFCPSLSSFTDGQEGRDFVRYKRAAPRASRFGKGGVSRSPEDVKAISKTSLNELLRTPRDYFFSHLVAEPDRDYFRKGSIFHDFAEFYANFPDFVEKKGSDEFIRLMVRRMEPIVGELETPLIRTEFRLGVKLLREFFQESNFSNTDSPVCDGYVADEGENFFLEQFNKSFKQQFTEMNFYNEQIGVKGKVDLLNGEELVDYKTGKKNSPRQIVKESNVDLFGDSPDFQALLYLSHHRHVLEDRHLKFTFLYPFEEAGKILRDSLELSNHVSTVTYYPRTFPEFLCSDEVYEFANSSSKREKLLNALGKDNFLEVLSRLEFERGDFYCKETAGEHKSQLKTLCENYLDIGRGRDLTELQLDEAVSSILQTSLWRLRTENYFKEDLNRFEEFIEEKLEDLNKWRKTKFPVGDRNLDEASHRDLILTGEGR